MNANDRKLLGRLYDAVLVVPLPHNGGGGPTASVLGMVAFQADMRELRPMLCEAITSISRRGFGDEDDPEAVFDRIDTWVEERKAADWRR